MVDETTPTASESDDPGTARRARRRAASRPAGPPQAESPAAEAAPASSAEPEAAPKRRSRAKADETPKAAKAAKAAKSPSTPKTASAPKTAKVTKAPKADTTDEPTAAEADAGAEAPKRRSRAKAAAEPAESAGTAPAAIPLFQAPEVPAEPAVVGEPTAPRRRRRTAAQIAADAAEAAGATPAPDESSDSPADADDDGTDDEGRRRRRRRGGRGRKRRGGEGDEVTDSSDEAPSGEAAEDAGEEDRGDDEPGRRRRRRRRRGGEDGEERGRTASDDVTSLRGSTRLEAKKQRRREGREAGRRRAPILTEAEFLARRESVERVMVVRQKGDRTQVAVLEDGVLVEHYVTRGASASMVGNVYLGRVQNVLPSMEAAFVDIGRGRNAVLYAGEVNWDAAGLDGQPKRIELAMKSGDAVLVQVTKDPVGQKGARLTAQVSLPGRFLVYVPDGSMTGISRKLPDTERTRLKAILKRVMPENAGVIVRTAAEGAPEDALEQDVARLAETWQQIEAAAAKATPPTLLHGEPDLAIKVVRDLFNEDVTRLVVSGDQVWASLSEYIGGVAPDLAGRLEHWVKQGDVFAEYRVDEQLMKALDRKVFLPSGGSLVIDRTEAMTVVDVNTGKFTGQGGNLEQTVTRNNLEAAEEIVRQLRLRDIGGIIVVDFIDMVLESNRDLVLRRLVECLGRDRTKHQVAEVTSLGLVQMTRKRIGSGLLESFSTTCDACSGRGIRVSLHADHDHAEGSPRGRKPANAVDPAEVAARALLGTAGDGTDVTADEAADDLEAVAEDLAGAVEEFEAVAEDLEAAEAAEADPVGAV